MPEPACEECGFLLTGHADGAAVPRCPECGTLFDAHKPWTPPPIPPLAVALRKLIVPQGIVLAVFLAAAYTRIGRNLLVWPFLLIWASTILGVGVLWPVSWAYETARERAPRMQRSAMLRRWLLPSILINLVAVIAAVLAFVTML